MNATVYAFGQLGAGYTQYPDDYTRDIFTALEQDMRQDTQLLIRRRNDIIYYVYVRRLSGQAKYIGLCIVFNGVMLAGSTQLCKDCEECITSMVVNGEILYFAANGDIHSHVDKLYKVAKELGRLSSTLKTRISSSDYTYEALPPVDFSVSLSKAQNINVKNDNASDVDVRVRDERICQELRHYGNINVYFGNTASSLSSYADTLRKSSQELDEQKKANAKLQEQYNALQRKKSKQGWVAVLVILVLVGVSLAEWMYETLNSTKADLSWAQSEVHQLNSAVDNRDRKIGDLEKQLQVARQNYINERDARISNEAKCGKMAKILPISITAVDVGNTKYDRTVVNDFGSSIYSSQSCFLTPRITYDAYSSGSITLNVRLYSVNGDVATLRRGTSSPYDYSYSWDMTISQGTGVKHNVGGWGSNTPGHWSAGKYRFEIWYNNVCLKAKTFNVY